MKFLRKQLDAVEPLFKKGGKLEKLYPLYEAKDTFLFTPGEVTKGPTHVRDAIEMKRMMSTVIFALIPCILMALYNTGYQTNIAITEQGASPITDSITGLGFIDREQILTAIGFAHDPTCPVCNILNGLLWFLPVYIVTMAVGGICELIFSIVRGHEINEGFLVTECFFR